MAKPGKKVDSTMQFQWEVDTERQWRSLLRREGLILIDVYASWCGPCTSMISVLKRVKVEVNDERLYYGMACSDNIDDLLKFKDQSEPTWLFVAGGKPIRVFRGSHVPNLVAAIKSEFAHEVECLEGKSRRNFISIDDEVSRKRKVEAEATRLSKFLVEEEDIVAKHAEIKRESSISLMGAYEPYTVAIIQPYLVEAGSDKEIKDFLAGDFKIEQDILVHMTEDLARHLYKVPYEVPDPNADEFGMDSEADAPFGFGDDDGMGDDDESKAGAAMPTKTTKKKKKTIPVSLPDGLTGDCVILLLEHEELKDLAHKGQKPADTQLVTADDYLRLKVGPIHHKDAVEHAPNSLRAIYGREHIQGIWCPRNYGDKRYVILNFFPNFMEKVMHFHPLPSQKFMVAALPIAVMDAFITNEEVFKNAHDVVAQGKKRLSHEMADEMIKSWDIKQSDVMMIKANLTTNDTYVVSFNPKNKAISSLINSMNPIHVSKNDVHGRLETSKIFKELHLLPHEEKTAEELVTKFISRTAPRFWTPEEEPEPEPEVVSTKHGSDGSTAGEHRTSGSHKSQDHGHERKSHESHEGQSHSHEGSEHEEET